MATWNCSCSFFNCSASCRQPGIVKLAINMASVSLIHRITWTEDWNFFTKTNIRNIVYHIFSEDELNCYSTKQEIMDYSSKKLDNFDLAVTT